MGLEITYKRVIQPRPFESVSLEVKRCFDDTDSDGFLKQDITKTFKEKDELKYYILGSIREVNSNIELSHIELFDKEIEDMWNGSTLNNKNARVIFKDVLDEFVDKIINGYKEIRLDSDELLNEILKIDSKIERNKYVIFQAKNWFSNKYDGSSKRTSKKVFSNYDILRYALELKRVIELNNE